jgi:ABC-2 type transport system ATP-binding protein
LDAIISTQGLTKRYKSVAALTDLTLEIRRGEVFGLVGPNGSGKTTAIRLMLGMLRPSAGFARIGGHDCWRDSRLVHEKVSFLPGEIRLFGSMTGRATLEFLSGLRGGRGLDRALAIANQIMKLDLNRKVRTYSTGMKQKLALAQTFADPVEILILDEPTAALDPSARGDVLRLIAGARDAGQTVLFSGHVLSEVEDIADRVGILRLGKLMQVEDLKHRRNVRLVQVRFNGKTPEGWPESLALSVRSRDGNVWMFEHRGDAGPLLRWLAEQQVEDIAIGLDDLQSLYDSIHGQGA